MSRNIRCYAVAAGILCACLASTAQAVSFDPQQINPSFVRHMLQLAAIPSEVVACDMTSPYPRTLHISNLKGSTVLIGFPPSGIREGSSFMLEIDGMLATVSLNKGRLSFLDGDRRIVEQGIFGTLDCIFNEVLTTLAAIFDAILSLDILGLIEAIVSGVLGVISCILF